MGKITRELIAELPKSDLHVHIDGSLRLPTLIELAQKKKITLPSYTEEGLKKLVFKDSYESLIEYLKGFFYTCAVMDDPESLERVSYEFAWDNFNENVFYIEPRYAPQRLANPSMSSEETVKSVYRGLERAKKEINATPDVVSGEKPSFEYGIIGCALRFFDEEFSSYYKNLHKVHAHAPKEELYAMGALELARMLVELRDQGGLPIVGIDLAGAEKGFPAGDYWRAFHYAHRHFLKKTVHAGEAYGPPSIFQAITELYADRIGHGTYLFNEEMIETKDKEKRRRYVQDLVQYIADRRITFEVCLTSNLQTSPKLKKLKNHTLPLMQNARLSVTFCTDNRLVSNTSVTNEIDVAVNTFDISAQRLKSTIIYGFKRSFFPGNYREKRKYVRKIIDYYEKVQRKHTS
ncbi:adenosine deaminase family protein [bacterium]|nr:adenosine deaminase family protein [bacterium]